MTDSSQAPSDAKRLVAFLAPTWLSSLICICFGGIVIFGTVLLTHVGSDVQQSLIGLHSVYSQSSVGTSVQTIGNNFGDNTYLNNALLFLLWGSVGLVVYSIVQSGMKEFGQADKLLHELNYVHANRRDILRNVALRAAIRLGALCAWWIMLRFIIFTLVPYAIATAHICAMHLLGVSDWAHSLLAGAACALGAHVLIVLVRLVFLRPRLVGEEILV